MCALTVVTSTAGAHVGGFCVPGRWCDDVPRTRRPGVCAAAVTRRPGRGGVKRVSRPPTGVGPGRRNTVLCRKRGYKVGEWFEDHFGGSGLYARSWMGSPGCRRSLDALVVAAVDLPAGDESDQRWTWLIQDEPVGVKCVWGTGMPGEPGPDRRGSCGCRSRRRPGARPVRRAPPCRWRSRTVCTRWPGAALSPVPHTAAPTAQWHVRFSAPHRATPVMSRFPAQTTGCPVPLSGR
jgi:hypothetical protein